MCLQLEVELPPQFSGGVISARHLSRETGLHVTGYRTADGCRRFHFARGKECSCGLLADDFQIRTSVWPLEPDAAHAMAKAISLIAAKVSSFTVRSVWLGSEEDPTSVVIAVPQLLETLCSNRLPAHTLLQVQGAA